MRADDDTPTLAWERFYAKQIDAVLTSVVVALLFLPVLFGGPIGNWSLLALPLLRLTVWACGECLMVPRLSWTPGRWVMGLRVEAMDGGVPSTSAIAVRTALLAPLGLGLWLPGLAFIAATVGGVQLDNTGATTWDKVARTRVVGRPTATWQSLGGFALWVVNALSATALAVAVFSKTPAFDALMGV